MEQIGTLEKSIQGGKWMFVNTVTQKILSFGSIFILARLLVPRDFGVIAIMLIVPPMLDILTSVDFESALIYKKINPYPFLNGIWTLNVVRSFLIFVLVFATGPYIAKFFHMDSELTVIRLGGLLIFLSGLSNVAQFFFFKEIDFKKIFIRDISGQIAYTITAIGLALYLHSFWALFFANIALYATSLITTYLLHSYRPKFTLHFKNFRELIPYTKWTYGQGILSQVVATIESAVIGRFIGATEVGLYTKANGLAGAPITPLLSIINKVGFPVYSRVQEFGDKVREGFLRSLDILFFITIPFLFLVFAAGDRLVLIALGKNWTAVQPLFKILAAAAALHIVSALAATVFNALGYPRFQFIINAINFILLIPLLLMFAPGYGVKGVAFVILATSFGISLVAFSKVTKLISVGTKDLLRHIVTPLFASIVITLAGKLLMAKLAVAATLPFLALVASMGIIYFFLIFFAERIFRIGPFQTLRLILLKSL